MPKVPLVIYENGERKIIGEATVGIDDNGNISMIGSIDPDKMPDCLKPDLRGLSIGIEEHNDSNV